MNEACSSECEGERAVHYTREFIGGSECEQVRMLSPRGLIKFVLSQILDTRSLRRERERRRRRSVIDRRSALSRQSVGSMSESAR